MLFLTYDSNGIFSTANYSNYKYGLQITNNNFSDKTILSENIENNAISLNHLSTSGKNYLANNIKIISNNIVDNSLYKNNFSERVIEYDKLDQYIKDYRINNALSYLDDSILNIQIKDNSLDVRLLNIGTGIFDKNCILYNITISKPDINYPETIDTYQLAVYSIKNAYELKTYQQPLPDQIYINPLFIILKVKPDNIFNSM